uniref:RNAbinding protein putative n=1 Tax=Albugo laibachii Nc14 TaxID=890382 RepID=F0WGX3_9STRA|nr:RNAbinding protein putative [Albugo laibachii Nc14]|eukprot:CCA20488.1 RNAbinding protein putative [Albugo laibachii Nc14]
MTLPVETTRLYVRNLPTYVDNARLRAHFESQGEVTDAAVVLTKADKKSRRFGFVGYKTSDQARRACAYFHQTYFDSCKLNVSFAVPKAEESVCGIRPWSKYSSGSSQFAALHNTNEKKRKLVKGQVAGTNSTNDFEEFAETMKARSKARFWANDDVQNFDTNQKSEEDRIKAAETSNSDTSEDTMHPLSDMEYLRSKAAKCDNKAPTLRVKEASDKSISTTSEPEATQVDGITAQNKADYACNRLFVRNLPFSAVEEDLRTIFEAFGKVAEVHIPLDETKRRKGFGFVSFDTVSDAQKALQNVDGIAFQGRVLYVTFAEAKPEITADPLDKNLSYREKKTLEKQANANQPIGWNASHIRSDAAVGTLANRMGIARSDVLSQEHGNMAVRLALCETMLVKENKDFFSNHGVDLSAIQGALLSDSKSNAKSDIMRSTTVILIKNLPHTTEEDELCQKFGTFGQILKFLLAPSRTVALIEFVEASEARKAFRSLAYRKYQHVPLYLEWAPLHVFTTKTVDIQTSKPGVVKADLIDEQIGEAPCMELRNTLCLKNLSFTTRESTLETYFSKFGKLRKVTIAKSRDKRGGILSMGFGFVEFADENDAQRALSASEQSSPIIDGHSLRVTLSQKKVERKTSDKDGKSTSKIIIRNVAFEATVHDIRSLCGAFGQLKRVRMPKKFDGRHRGFAFVEFMTEQEAKDAFNSLCKSHLYGRHLVLEWAEEEENSVESLRVKAKRDLLSLSTSQKSVQEEDDFSE